MATFFQIIIALIYYPIKTIFLIMNSEYRKWVLIFIFALPLLSLLIGKNYQLWDDQKDRGAIAITDGAFGEDYPLPTYLPQGWKPEDSLWFYNTTQGSALLPYDFFLVLEQADSEQLFRSNKNIDKYRYLPQQKSFFNDHALPLGFVKETYQDKDYVGYTCAACHTAQINYTNLQGEKAAIRIDGGPAMADMVGFLTGLEHALHATLTNADKKQRFIDEVIKIDNNYDDADDIIASLEKWMTTMKIYNSVNHSSLEYGYARLDAFGRIYNRVLQNIINKEQFMHALQVVASKGNDQLLSQEQILNVLDGVGEYIITNQEYRTILDRLKSKKLGFPGLDKANMKKVRDQIFNEANAPVSYPYLWDIAQSDYVQWNGVAHNSDVGPIGRNTGEVIGVFAILDWYAYKPIWPLFSLSEKLTGQQRKEYKINFQSSADLSNLRRLESHLKLLQSPDWPADEFGAIDPVKAARGKLIYFEYCQSCHEIMKRDNLDRIAISQMIDMDFLGTDPVSSKNAATHTGKSGNLKYTTQTVSIGKLILEEEAPVVQILTAVTTGVIATPDADKSPPRRWLDLLYNLFIAYIGNDIPNTVKQGNYKADTTSKPYDSLLAYKARPLNGIWATAPYLHNGSVPTLYDLLLPKQAGPDYKKTEYRPDTFIVGSRIFDKVRVGFKSQKYDGWVFDTKLTGNSNAGHEYGAGKTAQLSGKILPPLTKQQRWDLVEYLKKL